MQRRMRADVALAFCSLLWGGTFVVVRGALEHVSVFLFLAVRFSLAALLLAIFQRGGLRNLKKGELVAGAALGLFMFGGYAFQTRGCNTRRPRNLVLLPGRVWCWCRCFWGFSGSGG